MAKKNRILLVDSSAILHVVKHSGVKQIKAKDKSTYILFAYLLKLQYFMQKTRADICVFARDGHPKDSIRSKIFPEYKKKRNEKKEKTEEQLALDAITYPQFITVEEEILPGIGFNNIFQEKQLEADDIIGRVCKTYTNCEIIIVTTDQDMYQLLTDTICVLNARSNTYFTKAKFIAKYGIEPKMWKRVKSYGGCSTDEVPGVPGVAEKTAIKYIRGELPSHYKTFKAIESKIGRKLINRNKSLVILPFRGTPEYRIKEDSISKIKLQGVAREFGFNAILNDLERWTRIFKGWH